MRQFFKILLACLLAIFLFVGLIFFFFIGLGISAAVSSSDKPAIEKNSILLLDMNKPIAEQGQENQFGELMGEPSSVVGLQDMIQSIQKAKDDKNIKGIYIKVGASPNGWATLQALRKALVDFKNSKKFVVSYGEVSDQRSYYVASTADEAYINPVGMMEMLGLSIKGTFFKGAMDKLDVKPIAFHCGQYKGAHEPYSRENWSEPNKYQLSVLLGDFYSEFLQAVSSKSNKDTATLAKMINNADIKFPSDALKYGLINGTIYADSVEKILKKKVGIKDDEKLSFVSTDEYVETITEKTESDKVAVLYANGGISDGEGTDGIYSKTLTKEIRKIAKDDDIKAVVLRVNSPGGSALASEVIYHELKELRKKKPIVISMGDYAASGGYYIACAGDSIFAEPNTLTGSIGVVGVMFNFGDMMKNKLGVTTDEVKTSTYAGFPSVTRDMTAGEKAWIQSYLDTTYTLFKSRVAQARNLSMEQVEALAQGHVYSGKLAKDLKLVDQFGGLDDAVACAKRMAKLTKYSIESFPKPEDEFQRIIKSITGKQSDDAVAKKILGDEYIVYKELKQLRAKNNSIQAVMPWIMEIR